MSKKKLVPRLRFKEFEKDGEWKKLCLDELVNIVDGDRGTNYPSKKDFTNDGHTLFLNASNVTKLGFKFEENQYISEIKSNLMGNGKLLLNDIILTSRGSIGNVGIYNERINGKYPYVRINSGMLILRNRNIADSYFIGQYLKSSSGKYQIKLISFGSAQPQLTKNDVSNYSVVHPIDLNEQRRIGDFLNKFDEMLQLQQSKVNKVKDLKSAYLSEMFPKEGEKYPKKRFEGFTEPWYKNKFNEITEYITSSLSANNSLIKGRYELYDANELIGYTNSSGQKQEYVTIIKDGSGVGRVRLLPKDSNFIGTMGAIVNKEQTDIHYIYAYLQQFNFTEFITGATVPHVYYRDYGESTAYHPSYEEQVKIGKLFKNLDNQISIEEEKLAKLEKLKQSYLNDMFV